LSVALKGYPAADFPMPEPEDRSTMRARGEEAVGELAQALLDNPVFHSAISRALGAGERALGAQRQAMGALNFASGSDVERLEKRLRSLSGRLEEIEDRLDDLADDLTDLSRRLDSGEGSGTGSS
jgi:chromosome segregation ATPase